MKIAILGWGSLVWDPRALSLASEWKPGGPILPIEFSRVSRDGRLTLVIDEESGTSVPTRFAESADAEVSVARESLRKREGTDRLGIASVDLARQVRIPTGSDAVSGLIAGWAGQNGIDAVVWTGLQPNFRERLGQPYSLEAAFAHIESLDRAAKVEALRYIRNAPPEVKTLFRAEFETRYPTR